MTNILLIGNGAREDCIAETFKKNPQVHLFSYMKNNNPGIANKSDKIHLGSYSDLKAIQNFAKENHINFAFVGPEDPLNNGVVDALEEIGIESIGPKKLLAQLETSKSFTRDLVAKYNIPGNPLFKIFTNENKDEISQFMDRLDEVVVKPDGLTGGKGVQVQGDHFQTKEEAKKYCIETLKTHPAVIVEEKLDGVEFSLQCLTDGKTVVATPPAQDHKRAYEGDKGPNTGGMGSYSAENHLLPFLKKEHVDIAIDITKKVAHALKEETGMYYRGIMYGGFMITKSGVKLIEYNARFGDPETMNVLPILKTDFSVICQAMITQELGRIKIEFEKKATVCKYAVPLGYPDEPIKNERIEVHHNTKAKIYYAAVDQRSDGLFMTGSRAIAVVGIGSTIDEAEKQSEEAIVTIKGKVFHRMDIGTKELIQKRIDLVRRLL